jgi:hypothetical protein
MNDHDYLPTLVTACGLILLLTIENWLPAAGNRHHRLRHTARNLTLGLLNALAVALLAAPLVASVVGWAFVIFVSAWLIFILFRPSLIAP